MHLSMLHLIHLDIVFWIGIAVCIAQTGIFSGLPRFYPILLRSFNYNNLLHFPQQWQGIAYGASGLASILPGDHCGLHVDLVDFFRNNQNWSASLHYEITRVDVSQKRVRQKAILIPAYNNEICSTRLT